MLTPNEIVQRARDVAGQPTHAGRDTIDGPRRRTPRVPFALLVTVLVVGSLAALLALNTASAANELRRHGLVEKNAAVAARVQDMRVKVAASAAPGNLARAAAELGMVPAGNPAFVVIGPDGKAVVMGKPKAATAPPVKVDKPKKKPTPTATPTAGRTTAPTTPTTRPTGTNARTASRSTTAPRPTTTARPTPTSTPTPVVTLPGGTR